MGARKSLTRHSPLFRVGPRHGCDRASDVGNGPGAHSVGTFDQGAPSRGVVSQVVISSELAPSAGGALR